MNRREHYLEAERMIQTVLDGSAAVVGEIMHPGQAERIQQTFALQLQIANAHAMLATASAYTAGEVGGAYDGIEKGDPLQKRGGDNGAQPEDVIDETNDTFLASLGVETAEEADRRIARGELRERDVVEHAKTVGSRVPQELLDQMRYIPMNGGKLYLPTVMWTVDERDTPKMIVETLGLCEAALTSHQQDHLIREEHMRPHRDRVARLLEAARRGVQ